MPGRSGLDLQAFLAREGRDLPMVFVSGHGDVAAGVQAMRAGAVSFLPKPFTRAALLAAVAEAMARGRADARHRRELADLRQRYDSLTARERDVFALVAEGLLNKTIADRLDTRRGHDQDPSRPRDGEDGRRVARGPRPHGRAAALRRTRAGAGADAG